MHHTWLTMDEVVLVTVVAQCIPQRPKHPTISLESTPPPHHPTKPPWALPWPAQAPWRYLGRAPKASTTLVFQARSHAGCSGGAHTTPGDSWRLLSLTTSHPHSLCVALAAAGGHSRARGHRGPCQRGGRATLSLAGSRSRKAHLV